MRLPSCQRDQSLEKLIKPPYSDKLEQIVDLLKRPEPPRELIDELLLFPNLVPLLTSCAKESVTGRNLLASLADADPSLLKQFVRHKLLLDPSPSVRVLCLQCIFDLIKARTNPENVKAEKSASKLSLDFKSDVSLIVINDLEESTRLEISMENADIDGKSSDSGISLSEDAAPNLKDTSSASWFINYGSSAPVGLPGISKDNLLRDLSCDSATESASEDTNVRSPEDQKKEEENWLKNVISTTSLPQPRRSILKQASAIDLGQTSSLSVCDSPGTSFMHRLIGFGVVVVLGDLASLDPDSKCQQLAEECLQLLLSRAPDSLLKRLPKCYGDFVRHNRQLKKRRASRPIHLDKSTRTFLYKLYGDLVGRTLVVGEGGGAFAEKLMSYFDSHCGKNAQELIISVYHDEINQLRRYAGFSDMHHKLQKRSRVNFHEQGDCKEYDPEEVSHALSDKVATKSTCSFSSGFMFGVDATKFEDDKRFENCKFNSVIWNFPQVETSVADHRLKSANRKVVAKFLKSVKGILLPSGTVRVALHENIFKHPDTGEVVSDCQYETWGLKSVFEECLFYVHAELDLPKSLYKATNVAGEEFPFTKATLYILKQGDSEMKENFLDSDDTFSDYS